ncbi:MAG TPA: protein kinase [Gemmataceae bacterium]|nr:protein kinase [Gemmataceae bacterium]
MKSLPSQSDEVLGELIDRLAGRIQAGKPVELESFLQQHPERAQELKELLPAIQVMAQLGQVLATNQGVSASPQPKGHELGTLGDFRILREVGRGGMGIVYEAEQQTLGRRVALKVLPFAATMDPRNLERFRNEAQAAAHLHHNHIVPVFGGGCERGVPYYVMQFIEGQTLAEVIFDLKNQTQPEGTLGQQSAEGLPETRRSAISTLDHPANRDYFRKIAQLGIQAAEALDYAHQRGVIHRDIKPANLILDATGNLWITDFGLANFQGNDARLTRTGDMLGTIRYMSPEQASPKRLAIGPRTDIYSLGTTLYELLTLEPAFPARDRAEMLVQLAYQEPRLPRAVNRAVPQELETIVLKAMAKNPDERYATAQELKDDLQRFLEDQPIRARRPTLAQRWLKWTRRHRALVRTMAAAAVVTVTALVLGLVLVWNEKNKTLAAYQEKEKALREKGNALQAEKEQRHKSEENVLFVMEALDRIYLRVEERWLPRDSSVHPQDQEVLEEALVVYERFAQKNADNVEARAETARAYLRTADVCTLLGREARAEDAYQKALDRFQGLVDEFPLKPAYRQDLGRCYANLGAVLENTRRLDGAAKVLHQAIVHRQKLTESSPANKNYQQELADSYHRLAAVFSAGDQIKQAEETFGQALSLQKQLVEDSPKEPKYQLALAAMYRDLAYLLWRNGRLGEASHHLKQGKAFLKPGIVPGKDSSDVKNQANLASLQASYGTLYYQVGLWRESETTSHRALKVWKELAAEFPNVPGFQLEVAATMDALGGCPLRDMQRHAEAKEMCDKALAILEPLIRKMPRHPKVRDALGENLNHLAILTAQADRSQFGLLLVAGSARPVAAFAEAEILFGRSLLLRQDLVKDYPRIPDYRLRLARVHHNLGFLLEATGRRDEAEKTYRQAIVVLNKVIDEFPRGAAYRFRLATVYGDLGRLLRADNNNPGAEKALLSANKLLEDLIADIPQHVVGSWQIRTIYGEGSISRIIDFQRPHAFIQRSLADLWMATGKFTSAEKAFRQYLAFAPNDPRVLNDLAWLLVSCPDDQLRKPAEGLCLVEKAIQIASTTRCGWNPKYGWSVLGVAHYRVGNWQKARDALNRSVKLKGGSDAVDWFFLAMTYQQLGEEKEARMWYQRATDWMTSHSPNEELQRFQKEAAQLLERHP